MKDAIEEELRVSQTRLTMVEAFVKFLMEAFDALLHHNVNYRNLPEYSDQTLLDEAHTLPLREGALSYHRWLERMTHAVRAAIRRKHFRDVNKDKQ